MFLLIIGYPDGEDKKKQNLAGLKLPVLLKILPIQF